MSKLQAAQQRGQNPLAAQELAGLDDDYAVRLVHELDLALWEQPVLLAHGRRNGDLAFACHLHANILAKAAR